MGQEDEDRAEVKALRERAEKARRLADGLGPADQQTLREYAEALEAKADAIEARLDKA
jgi:hypothetical protein